MKSITGFGCFIMGVALSTIGGIRFYKNHDRYVTANRHIPIEFESIEAQLEKYEGNNFREGLRELLRNDKIRNRYIELANELHNNYDMEWMKELKEKRDNSSENMLFYAFIGLGGIALSGVGIKLMKDGHKGIEGDGFAI
jgi:hypothetical protein